jgi:hypothetical protein
MFTDHPPGWRSPLDLAEGFLLAWALEKAERLRVDGRNPMAPHVRQSLPPKFRIDTLGELVRLEPARSYGRAATQVGRLTTLCLVWTLFDELDSRWRLEPGNFGQFSEALSFTTGGTDRRSLFGDGSADVAKCLLSDRITNRYSDRETLTPAEDWFVNGDPSILGLSRGGHQSIPFVVGGQSVPVVVNRNICDSSIWCVAQVLIDMGSTAAYIERYGHRKEAVLELLEKGAVLAERRRGLPPGDTQSFRVWPGWPEAPVRRDAPSEKTFLRRFRRRAER